MLALHFRIDEVLKTVGHEVTMMAAAYLQHNISGILFQQPVLGALDWVTAFVNIDEGYSDPYALEQAQNSYANELFIGYTEFINSDYCRTKMNYLKANAHNIDVLHMDLFDYGLVLLYQFKGEMNANGSLTCSQ